MDCTYVCKYLNKHYWICNVWNYIGSNQVFDESYPSITEDFIDDMFSKNESKDSDFAVKFYKRKMDARDTFEVLGHGKATLKYQS